MATAGSVKEKGKVQGSQGLDVVHWHGENLDQFRDIVHDKIENASKIKVDFAFLEGIKSSL